MSAKRASDIESAQDLASEYYRAAEEDYELLEYVRLMGFSNYGNGCMLAARYAEKMLKARLLRLGVSIGWTHDQKILVGNFPNFDGKSRALEIAAELTPYATQAAYPSMIRENISPEDAEIAYNLSMELVTLTSCFEPNFSKPRTIQTTLFNRRPARKRRWFFRNYKK